MDPSPVYSQIDLTDACGAEMLHCADNPVYGSPNDNERAIEYCMEVCDQKVANGEMCEGFFFQ